jgi:hypothetical protein
MSAMSAPQPERDFQSVPNVSTAVPFSDGKVSAEPGSLDRLIRSRWAMSSLGLGLFARRRREAIVMAVIPLVATMRVPSTSQASGLVFIEASIVALLFAIGWAIDRYSIVPRWASQPKMAGYRLGRMVGGLAVTVPLASRFVVSALGGEPAAVEIVMLSTLGIGAIALVFCSTSPKNAALSVVCSGFLMLFTTSISDGVGAVYMAVVWVLICLWWMLANHWERLEVHLAQSVRRHHGMRVGMTTLGLVICGLALMATLGRGPAARLIESGVMPTSGGNKWADPSARSGVGDGDAVVAAKDNALSFGAVESDIFLQSHQPSLFDLFDDVIGKPQRVRQSEKAISLPNQKPKDNQSRAVQSQQSEAGFSTSRQSKPKVQKQQERKTPTMLQWVGRPATHLALQRYNTYDGVDWNDSSNQASPQPRLSGAMIRTEIEDKIWYFRPIASSPLLGPPRGDAVKVINLRSPRIAAPATAAGVHIADVDREDFFGITGDGSLYMPDRSSVPSLTVIRLVSYEINADQLRSATSFAGRSLQAQDIDGMTQGMLQAGRLAKEWTKGVTSDWQRVERVIQRLREGFVFDRSVSSVSDDPLAVFFKDRRGGDHLFATAAAVMLGQLGFDTRLATGFYVPRRSGRWGNSQIDVLAEDAHVWCEVKSTDGVWIPLEPTPGYEPPHLYQTLIRRFATTAWAAIPYLAGLSIAMITLWLSRRVWGEWLCRAVWLLSKPIGQRKRMALLVRLLDWRGRLAGNRRGAGVTPRRWVEQVTMAVDESGGEKTMALRVAADRFFDSADAVFYGPAISTSQAWVADADRVASGLTVRALMKTKRLRMVKR